jgi:hypothetical protein
MRRCIKNTWSFPKGSSFKNVSKADVKAAVDALNNRPRKGLKFYTPNEIHHSKIRKLSKIKLEKQLIYPSSFDRLIFTFHRRI